jgi:hypothetical protein
MCLTDLERKAFASYENQEQDADWEQDEEGDCGDEEYERMMAEYEEIRAKEEYERTMAERTIRKENTHETL